VHYHNWRVTAKVRSEELNSEGFVLDFCRLKADLETIVSEFDNKELEKTGRFGKGPASAENVAKYIYGKLSEKLPEEVNLQGVKVAEQPGCWAKFSK
jgi:6-pyruvoyltetrahydropterin/6-carboxytetrahydropterin synthase